MIKEPACPGLFSSLATRLTLWYAASSFLIVLAATAILYWVWVSDLNRQDDQFLADEVHILQDLITERPNFKEAILQAVEWEADARRFTRVYERLLDRQGKIISETPTMQSQLPIDFFSPPVTANDDVRGLDKIAADGTPFRIVTALVEPASPDGVQTIQVAMNRVHHYALIRKLRWSLFLVTVAAFVICSTTAFMIAKRGIQPIVEVTKAAKRIRSTTLNERIESGQFPSEMSDLVDTFNEMLNRLQQSFDRLSQFSADIAHELRTPVNNMRGEAEVSLSKLRGADEYRESLVSNLEETVRLSRIIDSLLMLARAESPFIELPRENIDLSIELQRLRDFYEVLMTEADIQWVVKSPAGITINANRPLLQRAIGNLIENALRHTPSGGTISVCAIPTDESLRIEVADNGSGISSKDLPHVFDRFYRVEKDRSGLKGGSGLGLAIVRSIVELHGGEVSIKSVQEIGTTVTITILKQLLQTNELSQPCRSHCGEKTGVYLFDTHDANERDSQDVDIVMFRSSP